MKWIACLLALFFLCGSAHAADTMSYNEFMKLESGTETRDWPPDYRHLLDHDAKGDPQYQSVVYYFLCRFYISISIMQDRAAKTAREALRVLPKTHHAYAYLVLAEAAVVDKNAKDAAEYMDKALSAAGDRQLEDFLRKYAQDVPLRAERVSPVALSRAFENNELNASEQYKTATVVGFTGAVETAPSGGGQFVLKDRWNKKYYVRCFFDKVEVPCLMKLYPGDFVIVTGRAVRKNGEEVILEHCRLIQDPKLFGRETFGDMVK